MRNNYNEQLIRFEAEGVRVNFACYTRGNRSGFVHEVTMYEEGRGYATASESVQYYNRTWEEYTYQSVMGSIVYGLERRELERIRRVWMSERGYERMTAKRRAEFEADDTETPRLRFLRTLSFCIHGMPRPWHSCAGERERAILQDRGDVRRVELSEGHAVYRIFDRENEQSCDYDAETRRFVG